jgi:hypothetical protein
LGGEPTTRAVQDCHPHYGWLGDGQQPKHLHPTNAAFKLGKKEEEEMPTVNIFLLYYIRKEEEENRRG